MPEFMLEISPFSEIKNGDSKSYSLMNIPNSYTVKTVIKADNGILELDDEIFARA